MLNGNLASDESISENGNINNNNDNNQKREKSFMQLYPVCVEDSSPKNNNNYKAVKKRTHLSSTKDEILKEALLNEDGTYKINDLFLQLILKERSPLSKKKVHQTIVKFLQKSALIEKINREMNSVDELNFDNICLLIAQNMSFVEYKKNKSIYKVGDNGIKLFLIIRGKVNIYKPVKLHTQMTFKDYLLYCLLLHKHREDYLLNKIVSKYCKIIPIIFTDEIIKAFTILFKIELNEKLSNKSITNNKELKMFFSENEMNFYDFGMDERDLEKILPEKNKNKGNTDDADIEKEKFQEWKKYILKKCSLTYGETSYYEKFDKNIKSNKFDIEYYKYEFVGKVMEGNYFGDVTIGNDIDFLKNNREYSIFAEEDTIVGTIKNEEFVYIVAPNIKIERTKNLNFIHENYFFKPINTYIFSKNYFQFFKKYELTRENIIFECNTNPTSLFLVQEGIISLNVQCSLIQINNIIEKLYDKLITNKYYSEVLNKKLISKNIVNTIKEYANDRIIKNLKLHNENFVQEIKKIRNFQISIISKDQLIGLEEIFFQIPYITNGIIISEKCSYYQLPIEKLDFLVSMEPIVFDLYIKTSINKLLSLVERLQNLKQSIIDFSKNKYNDNHFIDKMDDDNSNVVIKTECNITDNTNISSFNKNENKDNNDTEKMNLNTECNILALGEDNFNNNKKVNSIDCDISLNMKHKYKASKRVFSSIKKQKINYIALENMKNEEKNDINNESDNHNNSNHNNNNNAQKRNMVKSAKKLSFKKKKYLYIEPVLQKERAGSVDVFKLNKHNKIKNENKIKDAMFIIDKYYTLDGIKKRIEKNKKKINIINKLYKNNIKTIKNEENIDENQNHKNEIDEESNNNIYKIRKTIAQDEYNNNCSFKNISLKLNVKNIFPKSKSINGNKNIYLKNYADNDLFKKKMNIRRHLFKINENDSNNKNKLIISHNYLFSSPSKLPKINVGSNNNNLNLDYKDCASNSIIDKMIEKTKKSIIPKIVKNFYDNKKNKGYIPFITNKKTNTIFLKKYGKKYDNNEFYTNIARTEENGKILPKIYK